MSRVNVNSFLMLMGRVKSNLSFVPGVARVSVELQEFNPRLKMFFPQTKLLYAHDRSGLSKPGDYVILHKLEEAQDVQVVKEGRSPHEVLHRVSKVVYGCGEIVDPVSGERVLGGEYGGEVEELSEIIGSTEEQRFTHKTAPPRGSTDKDHSYTPYLPPAYRLNSDKPV